MLVAIRAFMYIMGATNDCRYLFVSIGNDNRFALGTSRNA